MKKIYAIAAAAMFAMTANAQNLYLVGHWADQDWNISAPAVLELKDGVYTVELNGLTQFKLSSQNPVAEGETTGNWDVFNSALYGCTYGDEPGKAVALEAGYEGNIATPWKGDYKVEVAADLSTIKLSTDTPKPQGAAEVFFRGDMTESWAALPEWQWSLYGDSQDIYVFNCAEGQVIPAGVAFKIADADWNAVNLGLNEGESLFAQVQTILADKGVNMSLEEEWTGTAYLQLSTKTLYLGEAGEECPDFEGSGVADITIGGNGEAAYFNLQGVRVAQPENGLYIVVKDGKAVKTLVK